MIYSSLHHFVTSPQHSHDAWHAVEHVLVFAARRFLSERGNHVLDIVDVGGQTFDGVIFLNGEFYSEKALADYELFWQHPRIELGDVRRAIRSVELEERVDIAVDPQALLVLVRQLVQGGDCPLIDMTVKNAPHETIDLRVDVVLESDNVAQQKVFLRLRPPLLDVIMSVVDQTGGYDRGATVACRARGESEENVGFSHIVSAAAEVDQERLQNDLQTALDSLGAAECMYRLKRQFAAFAEAAWLKTAPIEYYRNTGTITSTEEIAELATSERLLQALRALRITVTPAEADDYDNLET